MTTKHCLKYEVGACHHQEQSILFDEPRYLVAEDDFRLRLVFSCQDCLMEVYFERTGC